jgi:iron complex outermembrane receptor protein
MQVLIDGRSIYEPVLGGVNWNNVPVNVDDIERIEIIRGPNASSYGSNSFLAVINIITRFAAEDAGYYVRSNLGNHGIKDLTYRFASQGDNLDYRITLTTNNDDGQDGIDGRTLRDDVDADVIDYRLDYQIDAQQQLSYQGGYSHSIQQARAGVRMDTFVADRDIENIAAYQFIRYENILNRQHAVKLQYYYNLFDKSDIHIKNIDFGTFPINDDILIALGQPTNAGITGTVTMTPFDFLRDESYTSQRHNLEVTHYYEPDNDFRLVWGLGTQKDIGRSEFYLADSSHVSRNILRVFSNAEVRLNQALNLNAGLLWEKNDNMAASLSPRLSIISKFSDKHTFHITYSEAIRTPFLAEQFSDITLSANVAGIVDITAPSPATIPFNIDLLADVLRAGPSLRNERIIARELGYYGSFMNDDLSISARMFHNSISDLIGFRDEISSIELLPGGDGEVQVFENLFNTTIEGIEVEFNYFLSTDTRLILNSSIIDIGASFDPADATATFSLTKLQQGAKEYQQSAPNSTISMMAIHRFNELYSGSFSFFYVGDMAWLDTNRNVNLNDRRNTGGYRKADLRLSRQWQQGSDRLSLSLVMQNIFEDYQDYDATAIVANSEAEQNLVAFIELTLSHK